MLRTRFATMGFGAAVLSAVTALGADPGGGAAPDDLAALKAKVAQLEQSQAEVKNLKSEVAQLRAAQGDNWLNERRAEEVKALVREVLADADTRASLMSNAMSAGYNGSRFFLASEDGTFLLQIGGQLQIRYIANLRDTEHDTAAAGNAKNLDAHNDGFQLRRVKLFFDGHIGNPNISYKIQLAADRNVGTVLVEDAWAAYAFDPSFKIWGGRFQDVFARESMMSSKKQQTVDRSAVANVFGANDGYVEGVALEWKPLDLLIISASLNDGFNSGLSATQDFWANTADVAFTGRADVKLAGDFKNSEDVEAWSSSGDLQAFLGGAIHYELGKSGLGGAAAGVPFAQDFFQATVDGLVKFHGLSVMAAGYYTYLHDINAAAGGGAGAGADLDYFAAMVQAGFFVIPDKLEPFVRYEWINPDEIIAGTNDLHLVTVGANYFLRKHEAKFTVDLVWALSNVNNANTGNPATGAGTSLNGIGLLNDTSGKKTDQVAIRAQFQLLF